MQFVLCSTLTREWWWYELRPSLDMQCFLLFPSGNANCLGTHLCTIPTALPLGVCLTSFHVDCSVLVVFSTCCISFEPSWAFMSYFGTSHSPCCLWPCSLHLGFFYFCIQVDFEGVKLGLLSGLVGLGFHWLVGTWQSSLFSKCSFNKVKHAKASIWYL